MAKQEREREAERRAESLNERHAATYLEALEAYKGIEIGGDKDVLSAMMNRLTSNFQNVQAVMVVRAGRHQVRVEPVEPRKVTAAAVLNGHDRCEAPSYPPAEELRGFADGLKAGLRETSELTDRIKRLQSEVDDYSRGYGRSFRHMMMCGPFSHPAFGRRPQ